MNSMQENQNTRNGKVILDEEKCGLTKDWYIPLGEKIQRKFPNYIVIVSGGPYRFHDVSVEEVDTVNKVIRVDFYLPTYIDCDDCVDFASQYIEKVINNAA